MLRRYRAWSGALIVMAIAGLVVVLDVATGPVHRYWAAHAFTASVLAPEQRAAVSSDGLDSPYQS